MPSYVPAKKGVGYVFYVSLAAQAQADTFLSSPTLASGDFKVSTDGGALANLTTLPTITPSSSKMVKITLSTGEMNGDNVTVVCSDVSGAEWRDLVINIQTAARQIDDLAYPTTTGRSIDVTTTGEVGIDWANIGSSTAAQTLSATTVGTATTIGSTGLAAIWDRLTSALATSGSIGKLLVDNINAAIGSRASQTSLDTVAGYVDTEVAAIKAKTDNLPTDPADASDIAASFSSLSGQVTAVDTVVDAIQAKTDNLPSDPADASDIADAFAGLNDITVADLLAGSVEGSLDVQETFRLMLSVLVGKSSGGGTTNVVFRDTGDSTDRVDATVDGNGNRTSVTLDPS